MVEDSNSYERIVARTQEAHRLFSVHWELTYRCNQRCSHCYLDVYPPESELEGELTTEECFQTIDELSALGTMNLVLSGGEVLVRPDFFAIAEYARSKRMLLRLLSNGTLISAKVADCIAALHPFCVEVSLYSTQPERHDRITGGPGSWKMTTRALHLLRDRGVRTKVKVPLMRENIGELGKLEALAEALGAQFLYDTRITPKDSGCLSPLKHRLVYEDLVSLFRERLVLEDWTGRRASSEKPTCGISLNSFVIDPFGNVYPCVQTRILAGNLREQSLKKIWEESSVWTELGNLTRNELPVCRKCGLASLCFRCHGMAHLEDGDLRGPAMVSCREALARRQVLIEKGASAHGYPVPSHLARYAAQHHKESCSLKSVPKGLSP